MPLRYALIIYIIQCLSLNVYFIQSREYFIIEGERPSYLYRKFDHVDEEIFPKDITIEAAFSKVIGTLLYSIDRNLNQFIVTLRDDFHQDSQYGLEVVLNTQEIYVTLSSLCVCATCPFDFLKELILRFQVDWNYISIQCNGRNPQKFRNERRRILDRNYPILFAETYSWSRTDNAAHLWLVNHPIIGDIYPNTYQMYGCIFSVYYKEKLLIFTNISSNVGTKCKKSCTNFMCHGGSCHAIYSSETICNCTTVFSNGRYCNNKMKSMNFEATSQRLLMKNFKLSWKSDTKAIFELKNTFVRVAILRNGSNLYFEYNYTDHRKDSSRAILTTVYVSNEIYICVVYFREITVDIRLFSTLFSNDIQIHSPSNIGEEYFHTITMRSEDGVMDLVYKTNMEDEWSEPHITNRTKIKKEMTENLEIKMSEMTANLGIKMPVFILLFLFLVVVIPLFIHCKRKRDDLKMIKVRQVLCCLENGNFLDKSKYSKDMSQEDMWIDFARTATNPPMLTAVLLKLFRIHQESLNHGEYTRKLVISFIQMRIFGVPLTLKQNKIKLTSFNKQHFNNLINLLSKKYEYSYHSGQLLIDVMMDFLEDVSNCYLINDDIDTLIESIISYVAYYTIVNIKTHNKDITFLVEYLHKDNSIKVWASAIFCFSRNDIEQVNILKEYCIEESYKDEICRDAMVLYLALMWSKAKNNWKIDFTDRDRRIIQAIRECSVSHQWPINNYLATVFDNIKAGITESLINYSLNEDQKVSINCLYWYLKCGLFCENNLDIILSILDVFNPHIIENIIAMRIVEIILYHLCVDLKDRNEQIKSRIFAIVRLDYANQNVSEEIKIASSLIIYKYINPMESCIADINEYLHSLNRQMEEQHFDNYLGFSRLEIPNALSLMSMFEIDLISI